MSNGLEIQKLDSVFKSRPDILQDIHKAADSPSRVELFNKIANFIYEQTGDHTAGSSLKRRRVDIEPSHNGNIPPATETSTVEDISSENILLEIKDISVSIPQRKKFELCFTPKHLYARIPGATTPAPGIAYAWKDIEYAFYLPVPEKSQIQHNYVLFPRNAFSLSKSGAPTEDPLLFTVSASPPKPGSIGGPNAGAASAVSDSYTTLFNWALNKCLQAAGNNVQIVAADPAKFHSKVRQPHRPKEAAVHVKAFRGSKDGYLFFLENGILWGFKKPLLFIPLDKIAAISYTSVLQRTFNMVVEVFTGENGDETTEEIEFSMLDQEDYGGINQDYVMRHRLQDRSMADQRKAKRELAENAKGKKEVEGEGKDADGQAAEDGMTELERAQMEAEQQLQDEEDEDEEDYDPGSEGESEGSGTSSEEDDDDEDVAEDDEMEEDEELGEGE
ncbi:Rtt106-domain-containing protein [Daldinia vernicosa]|uniref:Rtt106-domain-containing protein n=1 Tax=Daldinia vernicosa TaxID=114800 RepID=UPI0020071F3B|nr:Rtt106-domain-containing protein [Daldinia vernicosa]KAI0853950.1 Rtt106-domain-containing protein [Daldinia vernicosa]